MHNLYLTLPEFIDVSAFKIYVIHGHVQMYRA